MAPGSLTTLQILLHQVWGMTQVSQVLPDQADAESQGLTTGASPAPVPPAGAAVGSSARAEGQRL